MRAALVLLALLALLSAPARADAPLTAAEFEAAVTGRTIAYGDEAGVWGTEWYRPGRRVTWAFTGGDCVEGVWYPEGDEICFAYEDREAPECWRFYQREGRLFAEYTSDPAEGPLYELADAAGGLVCSFAGA